MTSVRVETIGREREPVAIVEDFAPDPHALRRHAATLAFAPDDLHYPGVKAALAPGYFEAARAVLAQVLREVFGRARAARVLAAGYAIVTTPPGKLTVEQRIPHIDALDPGRIAIVHYLAPGDEDGTAFYRHRATGFETLDAARGPAYFAALNAELRAHAPPAAYLDGDTPIFEQTARVAGRFNRAILYRSRLLHSGAIAPARALPADPLTGRLTIASFLAAE